MLLMLLYRYGWFKQKAMVAASKFSPSVFISVIIPARNEAQRITPCLLSVLNQNYPSHLFEVIVVDDHSDDATARIVRSFANRGVTYLALADHFDEDKATFVAYKKKALAIGIKHSRGELIFTTDADCIIPPNHLHNLATAYSNDAPVFIAGPVSFTPSKGLLYVFQLLDFISMQGITVASLQLHLGNMCNGANLAFSKEAFNKVDGYNNTLHLASGDDYFLMWKMQQAFPKQIAFMLRPDAIVLTPAAPTFKAFLLQRIRWASKSAKYKDLPLNMVLILVYLFNVVLLALFIACLCGLAAWPLLALCLSLKIITELFFLYPVATFFKQSAPLLLFPLLQPLHIIYIVLTGFLGFIGSYSWKGRKLH